MGTEEHFERATSIHSFIVKIWLEEAGYDRLRSQARWHGIITEVPGGERKYIQDLGEISVFISTALGLSNDTISSDPSGEMS